MTGKGKDYTPPTSAEQRAMRELKQQSMPSGEAARREARFLQHLGAAAGEFRWILEHHAWTDLGFDTFTAWYSRRVQPVALGMGFRPSPEMAWEIVGRSLGDNGALPKAQRLLQRELAELAGVSESTFRRMLQDHSQQSNGAGVDLETQTTGPVPEGVRDGSGARTATGAASPPVDGGPDAASASLAGPPAPGPGSAAAQTEPGVTPEVHEHAGGSTGGPGQNSATCTCGVVLDGFGTPAEAMAAFAQHIGAPRCQQCGTQLTDEDHDTGYHRCATCDPRGTHWSDTRAGKPCAACTDEALSTDSPAAPGPGGPDRPAGVRQPGPDAGTGGSAGTGPQGVTEMLLTFPDADEEPARGGSSATGDERWGSLVTGPAELVTLLQGWARRTLDVDTEVVGPMLTDQELADIHSALDDIAHMVGLVERWKAQT